MLALAAFLFQGQFPLSHLLIGYSQESMGAYLTPVALADHFRLQSHGSTISLQQEWFFLHRWQVSSF